MQIKQVNNDNRYYREILNIYYSWWGSIKKKTHEEIESIYKEALTTDTFPKIYALIINDTLIGTYTLDEKDDIENEPYTPYLSNVYVKEKYRHQGYGTLLIEDAKNKTLHLGYKKLYLHSHLENYYEKYGFQFIKEVDTPYGKKKIFECPLKK